MKSIKNEFQGIDSTKDYQNTIFTHIVGNTRYNFSVEILNDMHCVIRLESPNEYKGAVLMITVSGFALSFGFSLINRGTRSMSDRCKERLYSKIEVFHNIIRELHFMKGWTDLIGAIKNKKIEMQGYTCQNEKWDKATINSLISRHYKKVYMGKTTLGNANSYVLSTAVDCIARRF